MSAPVDVLAQEVIWAQENAARSVEQANGFRALYAMTGHRQIRQMLRSRERITRLYADGLIAALARVGGAA